MSTQRKHILYDAASSDNAYNQTLNRHHPSSTAPHPVQFQDHQQHLNGPDASALEQYSAPETIRTDDQPIDQATYGIPIAPHSAEQSLTHSATNDLIINAEQG